MPTSFPGAPDTLTVPAGTTPTAFDTWAKTVSDGLPAAQNALITRLVAFATTGNVSIASGLVAGTVIDGVTAVAGTVGLVKNQTLPEENGLYVVPSSGAAVRHVAADSADDLRALKVLVAAGTVNAGRSYWLSSPRTGTLTVGTTGLTFTQTSAGDPLAISSTIVDAKGDLIVASAADTVARIAVGANATILTADSAQTPGVKWEAPASAATVSAVVRRDSAGRAQFVSPTAAADAATKGYVDGLVPPQVRVRRTTDHAGVTSSTTPVADGVLKFAIVANDPEWDVEIWLRYEAATAGDLRIGIKVPTGSTIFGSKQGLGSPATSNQSNSQTEDMSVVYNSADIPGTTFSAAGLGAGVACRLHLRFTVIPSTTAGDVELMFAQQVSDATATKTLTGSLLMATRVA